MAATGESERPSGDAAFRRAALHGSEIEASYAGARSFLRRKYTRDLAGVDVAVTGIPFDQATSNRPGARFGPEAIRRASAQLAWGPVWPWRFDPFDTLAVVDYGDCAFDWGRPQAARQAIAGHAAEILAAGVSILAFGGDHFASFPLLEAHAAQHGPLALVHFDAHRDVEPGAAGRIDHGTMFREAIEARLIDPAHSVQIGIRTTFAGERSHGMRIVHADEVHDLGPAAAAAAIAEAVAGHKAYLSFDIDCLDPAFAPGTGTPVPGGLSSHQALSILRRLGEVAIVGMDIVEVSPPYDPAEITALAAATIGLEYLCLRAVWNGAKAAPLPA